MFPMTTPELVRAEQSSRLAGFRRWSRRHPDGAQDLEPGGSGLIAMTEGGSRHRRRSVRPVLGR